MYLFYHFSSLQLTHILALCGEVQSACIGKPTVWRVSCALSIHEGAASCGANNQKRIQFSLHTALLDRSRDL
jgi:hypothetical protein